MNTAAAGLGALGFWIFLTAIIVAGIWYDARRRESQQETLRRVVESGKDIEPAVIDRLLGTGETRDLERDLMIGSYITLAIAPGLFIFGLVLGMINGEARVALIGVSLLALCVGGGLYLAARLVKRRYPSR